MAKRYHIGSHLAWLEVGGKFRNAHKFDNTFGWTMHLMCRCRWRSFRAGSQNSDYYNGAYKLGPNPAFQDVFAFVNSNLSSFAVSDDSGAILQILAD